jgi:hypothetical protein
MISTGLHFHFISGATTGTHGAYFFREELRLLPGRKVSALGKLVVVDELRIRPLCPTPRRRIEFIRNTLTVTGTETPLTPKNEILFSKHSE